MTQSKILVLDIETKPIAAYVWRLWDQNVALNQIIDDGGILCVGLKWVGDKQTYLFSEWEHGKDEMLTRVHEFISEADAVITFNGDKFDLTKLNGEFLLNDLAAPPPVTSIDLLKTVKKLGFISNKLAFVGPALKIGAKLKHEGFELWTSVMAGDTAAQKRMSKYCVQDVVLTEQLYKKLIPYIRNHPHLGTVKSDACGACGSKDTQKRGFRRTKSFRIQRIQCNHCGSWSDGKREKVT